MHKLLSKDIVNETGVCLECGDVPIKYVKHKKGWRCKVAHLQQKGSMVPKLGYVTTLERTQRLAAQGNLCLICRDEMKRPTYDHSHKTKEFRGFLCGNCNAGLGMFQDNPEILRAAAVYLEGRSGASSFL